MNGKIAIVGCSGAIGANLGAELLRREKAFIGVGRSAEKLGRLFPGNALFTARAADLETADGADTACAGVDTIVYAVGVPYHRFELHPVLMRNTVDAAIRAGVRRLLVVSSVYSYGAPRAATVGEDHPREPQTRKGAFRKQQEDIAMQAHRDGKLQTIVLHLPDFLGPHALQSFSQTVVDAAIAGTTANWLGDPSLQHEFIFLPDAATRIANLLEQESGWGERYNIAGPGTIAGTDFIHKVYEAANRKPRFRTAGKGLLRVMGLFNPLMRELVEMQYLMETPVVLDDRKLCRLLGEAPRTSYDDAIRQTVEWRKRNP